MKKRKRKRIKSQLDRLLHFRHKVHFPSSRPNTNRCARGLDQLPRGAHWPASLAHRAHIHMGPTLPVLHPARSGSDVPRMWPQVVSTILTNGTPRVHLRRNRPCA
jgi:hypothetical protein